MKAIGITCHRATELVEKRSTEGLSPLELLSLRMHTAMCAACTLYERQSRLIDAILQTTLRSTPAPTEEIRRSADALAKKTAKRLKTQG